MDLIKVAQEAFSGEKKEFPAFKAGDTVTVTYKIKEGDNAGKYQKLKKMLV